MSTIDIILSRRSHRQYLEKDIDSQTLDYLLNCGLNASFGGPAKAKCQVTEFIVIKDSHIKSQLALAYDDRQFIKDAPVVIACCANTLNDPQYNEWMLSASLSIQNVIIAAESIGLGCCILSCFINHAAHVDDKAFLRNVLQLPKEVELIALLSIGYKDEREVIPVKTYRDRDCVVFNDHYGNGNRPKQSN